MKANGGRPKLVAAGLCGILCGIVLIAFSARSLNDPDDTGVWIGLSGLIVMFGGMGLIGAGQPPSKEDTREDSDFDDGLITRWVGQHVAPLAIAPEDWDAIPARSADRGTGYRAYLMTDEWRARRAIKLRQAGHRCQLCNGTGGLDVHHRTYERAGNERIDDLIVLCRSCHDVFHQHRRVG